MNCATHGGASSPDDEDRFRELVAVLGYRLYREPEGLASHTLQASSTKKRRTLMLVARLHGIGDLRIADEPPPAVEAGMSLVKVTAVGICGSDLHWWTEGGIGDAVIGRPLIPGHEAAGIIGSGPRAGEPVAIDPAITCGHCELCLRGYRNLCVNIRFSGHGTLDGAMAELIAWPSQLLPALPEALSASDGALLEPLGVAIHSVDLGHLPLSGSAAVVGCGPIGLLLIQLLRSSGAGTVIAFDPLPHRREAALRFGADQALDPGPTGEAQLAELTGLGVDVAFEMAGADDAVQLAVTAVRPGGRVVLGGIPGDDNIRLQASAARRKGLTIAMVRRMNDTYPRAIALAAAGKVDLSIVSHRFPLVLAADAMSVAALRQGHKTIVECQPPATG
jgi:L-iditol 2-dehydrogenase